MNNTRNIQRIKNEFTKKVVSQLFDAFEIDKEDSYRKGYEDYRELILVTFMAIFGSHWDDSVETQKNTEEIENIRRKCLTRSPNYEKYFDRQSSSDVGAISFGNNYPRLNSIIALGKVNREAADIEYTKLICQQIRNSIAHGRFFILNDGTVQVWNDYTYPDGVTPDFKLRLDFMCIVDVCIDLLGKDENVNLENFLKEVMIKSGEESGKQDYADFIDRLSKKSEHIEEYEKVPKVLDLCEDIGKELFLKLFIISFIAYNEDYVCKHFFNKKSEKDKYGNDWVRTDEICRLFGVYDNDMDYLSKGDNYINAMNALLFIHDVRNAAVHNHRKKRSQSSDLILQVKDGDTTVSRRRYKSWNQREHSDDKYEYKDITYSYEDVLNQITYFVRQNMLTTEKGRGELFIGDEISIENDSIDSADDFKDR